jgi:transcriptional regulator with XRE-family HTH domain
MDANQARIARAALKMSVRDVGELAKVSPNTVTRVEAGHPVNNSTIVAIRAAFESTGVIFVAENGEGPGVRLRKSPRQESIPSEDLNASNDE